MEIVLLAFFTSLGLVFTLWKIFGMYALKYDWAFDIFFTVVMPILLVGTYAGMMTSILAGIMMSIELYILKKLIIK